MPFQVMDQRGVSDSSHFFDDIAFHSESNAGLRKPKYFQVSILSGKNGMIAPPGSTLSASSPFEVNAKSGLPMSQTNLSEESVEKLPFAGEEGITGVLKGSMESLHYNPESWSDVFMQSAPTSYRLIGNKVVANNVVQRESSLFSSSLSDMFSKKLNLLGNDVLSDHHTTIDSLLVEEPYKSLEDMEADSIRNLLPDEDDLFSGVADELGYNFRARTNDDLEDFDLFSSGGGMELEGDEHSSSMKRTSGLDGDYGLFGGSKGKLPFDEQPSRTLFVRNINSSVEDFELKTLFEKYGDIRTMYTACKHRGFVMIHYYDLRAAQNAMQALQNKPLRSRKLDIHYSIPKVNAPERDIGHGTLMLTALDPSVTNDDLKHIFGFYGEIKEIYENPELKHLKFVEFYDVRAAEAALRALNRIDIAGKQIKLEPGHPSLMQQTHKGQDERDLGHSIIDNMSLRQKPTLSSGVIGSGFLDNGYSQRFQSAMRQPLNAFIDNNAFFSTDSSVHNTVRGASIGKVSESRNLVDAMKFASSPTFHPHSLPEYHGSFANGSSYNFSSTISNKAGNIGAGGVTEASNGRHIQGISSIGNLAEFNGGGLSGNGMRPHHGLNQMWSNPNFHQQPSSSPVLWQKTPSFVNGGAPGLSQMSSFARTPPHHMLRTPQMDHHVGSAPVVTASPWERKNSYLGESPEASGFHGSWQMRPTDFSPHNKMFSHVGGTGVELSSSAGQSSPNQLSHILYGRQHPTTSMSKFDSTNERMRNLYTRKSAVSEANTNNVIADKKQYELDLGRILRGEDCRTTLMIKNIPNKYTSKMLLVAIDEQCRGTYDFLYLPIDFKNKCNVGYAFINMTDPGQIIPFHQAFHGKKWEKFNSEKVASLAYARIQGRSSLVAHFQNSSLMNEDKRCRPILFHTEGPNAGDMEPFPVGANVRVRPGKSRNAGSVEENRSQVSTSSTIASGEESANGIEEDSSRNSD
ncbi:protein MEI2-like 1 isoform X2 [Cicer arietinum]|uniref:Protein MEI2-like 1 isoform X2 n=1 Tax=Cicer arietinum TaxID=3827 RepID=A0A1S3EB51_CICAR|nr:protein MEI2-like 1 isoform X2 [Cicer arietinum]